jgi:hypothetical protein
VVDFRKYLVKNRLSRTSYQQNKGEVTIPADIEGGEVRVRIDGSYLTEALKACGSMVDFRITDGKSLVLFTVDGYQLVVMPMLTADNQKPIEKKETTEPETQAETTDKAEAVAEAESITKAEKPKRSRKKEPVAVG